MNRDDSTVQGKTKTYHKYTDKSCNQKTDKKTQLMPNWAVPVCIAIISDACNDADK